MVIPCILALFAGVTLTIFHYQDQARQQSIREISSIAYQIPQILNNESADLASLAQAMAYSDDLSLLILQKQNTELFHHLIRFLALNRLDFVEVTDDQGVVLANLVDSLCTGTPSENPQVNYVLDGDSFGYGLYRTVPDVYVAATIPVAISSTIVGAITVGKLLDDHLIQQLNFAPGSHIAFWPNPSERAIAPAEAPVMPSLEDLLSENELNELQRKGNLRKSIELEGAQYQCQFSTIDEIHAGTSSVFAVYQSLGFLDDAWNLSVVHNAALLILVALVLIQAIFWISHHITRPLRRLIHSMRHLCEIQFNIRTPLLGKSEVAALTNAFDQLSHELERNIAKRDIYADELKQLNNELEHLVSQRTEALEHANLQLKREIEEQDGFMRALSYDLGAPLRNIGGLIKLVQKRYSSDFDEAGLDLLSRIHRNVMHNLEMIQRLLEVSRLKARPPRLQIVDLTALLTTLKNDFAARLKERNIHITMLDILPKIRADKDHMRKLFQNLIDNAIKYIGDQPSPEISIGWSENPDNYMFWVSDNGRGIPDDQKKEIFGMFHRGGLGANQNGMGVGLATVKAVAGLYSGEVWVESQIEAGTTLYFTLKRSLVDLHFDDTAEESLLVEEELEEAHA
ncbi:HAMP domain-containing protein [bacterium]|nr:HAMP domain-containing protein [bacterium]